LNFKKIIDEKLPELKISNATKNRNERKKQYKRKKEEQIKNI
jgi:hypothetical protein